MSVMVKLIELWGHRYDLTLTSPDDVHLWVTFHCPVCKFSCVCRIHQMTICDDGMSIDVLRIEDVFALYEHEDKCCNN